VGYDRPRGNRYYVYAFAAAALFIMLVACINYVNLATARASKRARGVGLRKILGAPRAQLIGQFLAEAMVFAFIAVILGAVLVELMLALTPLPALLGKPMRLNFIGGPQLALLLAAFSVTIGLLAGIYPAILLSSGTPLAALVSSGQARQRGAAFRKALVFLQLAISIAVIATALLMAGQMRFILCSVPRRFAIRANSNNPSWCVMLQATTLLQQGGMAVCRLVIPRQPGSCFHSCWTESIRTMLRPE
jgi:putative ABC transport system permease protein